MTESDDLITEIRTLLHGQLESRRRFEESARQSLSAAREMHAGDRSVAETLLVPAGATEVALAMVSASARGLAAAEALFGAAVESREALQRLVADVGER